MFYTWLTGAGEAVNHIPTDAIIYTGVALTFINVHLTVLPLIAWKINNQNETEF